MKETIFRKTSISRLSSPEQLDQLLELTSARSWIGLSAYGCLLGLALLWGAYGEIQTRVHGTGVLIQTGGVLSVVASAGGRVVNVPIRPGDVLEEGQVVARVEHPDLAETLKLARERARDLRKRETEASALAARMAQARRELAGQRRASAQAELTSTRERAAWLEARVASQERLLKDGIVTQAAVQATRRELQIALEQAERLSAEHEHIQTEALAEESARAQTAMQLRFEADEATREVERLEVQYERAIEVRSPYAGRVLEVVVNAGSLVGAGGVVARLDRPRDEAGSLEAVLYVPAEDGKRLKPGMKAQVSPSTFKREEYGTITATVTAVSEFPATREAMMQTLANANLVEVLSGSGAPYQVYARLDHDPATPSGFAWSSSRGPNARVESGTVSTASVSVETQRPLSLVLPTLRKWTGVGV